MAKLKVSELFTSLQGEGRYVGTPSLFLRLFGCNLRCPGFSRDHSVAATPNTEVQEIISLIPTFKELGYTFTQMPLAKTGCDTYAAVYPEFKDFSPMMTTDEIVDRIAVLVPGGFHQNKHLIITGGEPLLPGWQKVFPELIWKMRVEKKLVKEDNGDFFITFETNGTQELIEDKMYEIYAHANVHFSVSTKLAASGESLTDTLKPNLLKEYLRFGELDFKFVVENEEHVKEIAGLFSGPLSQFSAQAVYLMPVGGTNETYLENRRRVADLCMGYGYRYSPRLQNELYGNEWNT